MTVRDVIVLTYRDAAVLAAGVVASWLCIWLWSTSDDEDRWTPWHLIAVMIGFAAGWYARGWIKP